MEPAAASDSSARARVRLLRASLLRWYRRHRRDLPWRRTRDPYAIWVSEVMLQQTQVATVVPYYRRFLARFPRPAALAAAEEDEVLGLWSGLGYYRRARALLAGARAVMERHAGRVPDDPGALLALPGVGRYTAGAIASMAFGLPEPVLDGNVRRVLARVFAVGGRRLGRAAEEKRLWALAAALVDGPDPGDLNQALMELGALVCAPRRPDCPRCPLRVRCGALAEGRVEDYPVRRRPRATPRKVRVAVGWVRRGRHVLLARRPEGGPLRGAWDLPAVELAEGEDAAMMLRERLERDHGLVVETRGRAGPLEHAIMNRRLRLEIVDCRLGRCPLPRRAELRAIDVEDLAAAPVSSATRKAAAAMVEGRGCRSTPGADPRGATRPRPRRPRSR